MSLRLICGRAGTGKSQFCFQEIAQKIKHAVVAISQKFGKTLFFQNLSLQLHPKMMYNENNSNQTDTGKDG